MALNGNNARNGYGEALGLIETRGYIATVAATDAMCKAANVTLAGQVQVPPLLHGRRAPAGARRRRAHRLAAVALLRRGGRPARGGGGRGEGPRGGGAAVPGAAVRPEARLPE